MCMQSIECKMGQLDQLGQEDHPYYRAITDNKEDCSESCLEVCNFDGSLLKDGYYDDNKYPLRRGTHTANTAARVFVKVAQAFGGAAAGTAAPYAHLATYKDNIAVASFAAVQKGIFVSCATGNAGPINGTATNLAPWVLTSNSWSKHH
ncbi:Peptidase S8/S53 domain-containing protein [Artemisia annua]|uniref:Peptidase S8/S53 domain-containing protein n=1 Tax=Artemisia annua TaxID=35608 RepID=A0A2U1LNE6_ARTAN|nr:Peptidase S8/S53 domain-containing protein [Artemisia annua]